MTISKFLYDEMTWPEIKEIVKENRVVLITTATIEDHGPHLPLLTDAAIAWEVALRAAKRVADDVVLMPPNPHGYSPHHADFPGGIYIDGETFAHYLMDITDSLIRHGFKKILIFNAHGSNEPWINIVARLTVVNHPDKEVWCSVANLEGISEYRKALKEILTVPGGTNHACESETSLMLVIRPDLVEMTKAKREIPLWSDGAPHDAPSNVDRPFIWGGEWWSSMTESGILGDPTAATKEKGERLLDAQVSALVQIIKSAKAWKIRGRIDHH